MTDARRMEVNTAVYDSALHELLSPRPVILDSESFAEFIAGERRVVFIGDAVGKAQTVISAPSAEWIDATPLALDMNALAEKAFRESRFADIAYATPEYMKEYQATIPANPLNKALR